MEDMQKIVMAILISFAILINVAYVATEGFEDEFVKTIVVGSWTVVLLAIGASFRKLGLSKTEEKKLES